ncbi:hypothetical protein [Isoalcanivorax indicus]|uniref:hypothetical protein n=1 Tax=Isoalcanivorax indicus TaxID=2202653 RepID=UPI0013C3F2C1|nr:hypothetical protein [Isoalcanivorax indicus]
MRPATRTMILLMSTTLLLTACDAAPSPEGRMGDGWLTGQEDNTARFERLEGYLGGFSSAMWETGYRYQGTRDAIVDGNLALADYHWGKLRGAIENGYMKRPGRQHNAEAMFLEGAWEALDRALQEEDRDTVQSAFLDARDACMACHVAEEVPFMNDMPLFRDSGDFER